jgi:ribonuclease VapC
VILDSSALLTILLEERGYEALLTKLASVPTAGVGAPSLTETGIVLTARLGSRARQVLALFVQEAKLVIVPFGDRHWRTAVEAYDRYGKGRHAAGLNFGDCMAYATARLARQPLLCTGNDFARTDLELA